MFRITLVILGNVIRISQRRYFNIFYIAVYLRHNFFYIFITQVHQYIDSHKFDEFTTHVFSCLETNAN